MTPCAQKRHEEGTKTKMSYQIFVKFKVSGVKCLRLSLGYTVSLKLDHTYIGWDIRSMKICNFPVSPSVFIGLHFFFQMVLVNTQFEFM